MNKSDLGTVPLSLLQLPAGQLVQTLAKFAYNNTPSATTGITPFFPNKGYHPNITDHPECDLVSAHAQVFITNLDELHQQLWLHIARAQH